MYKIFTRLFRRLFQPSKYVKTHPEYIRVAFESGNSRANIDLLKQLLEKQKTWLSDSRKKIIELENRSKGLEDKVKILEKRNHRDICDILNTFSNIPSIYTDSDFKVQYINSAAKTYLQEKKFSKDDSIWNCAPVSGGYVYTSDKTFAEQLKQLYRFLVSCVSPKPVQHDAKTESLKI